MSGANLPPLKTRKLGRTNVMVTELGLGTAPLGELFDRVSDDEAARLIEAAWDGGVRYFDTSPWYGRGLAEHTLGRALYRKPRGDFVISTKIGRVLRRPFGPNAIKDQWLGGLEFQTVFDYGYDGVMRSFEDSLQRLGINRVDVLLIHDLDPWDHNPAALNAYFTAAQDERVEGARGIARGGRHRRDRRGLQFDRHRSRASSTCSTWISSCSRCATRCSSRTCSTPNSRAAPNAASAIVIGGGYNSGILATGAVPGAMYNYEPAGPAILERVRKIEAVCARHKVPLPAAALQFPLGHPIVASIIPGAIARAQVEKNVAAFRHPIPADFWAELKHEKLIRADAPTPA